MSVSFVGFCAVKQISDRAHFIARGAKERMDPLLFLGLGLVKQESLLIVSISIACARAPSAHAGGGRIANNCRKHG